MNLYEIVVEVDPATGYADHYSSTIVCTDTEVPAGEVPGDVLRHAEMLRRIAHPTVATVSIGWHQPKNTSKPGTASTIWLTGPNC